MKSKRTLVIILLASILAFSETKTAFGQPLITQQPADQTVNQGYSAAFQVRAAGTPPLNHQWHFNLTAIGGATTNSLTISNTQPASAGDYFVVMNDTSGSVTSRVAKLTVIPPAMLDPKVGPNIRLGDDPAQLPTNRLAQFEPHIARSVSDPNLVVAIFQEGRHPDGDGGAAGLGYAVSSDGGSNWARRLAPGFSQLSGGTLQRATDPVAAFDLAGNIFFNGIGFDSTGSTNFSGSVFVSTTADGGKSFSGPFLVGRGTNQNSYLDKNWFAINTYADTPHPNRIAVSWTEITIGIAFPMFCSTSDDGGRSWTRPLKIAGSGSGSQPMFLPDGALAVVFTALDRPGPGDPGTGRPRAVSIVTSPDGGTTFSEPRDIVPITKYDAPLTRDAFEFVSACTERQTSVIYVTWQALFGTGAASAPRIMFMRSIDAGATWPTPVPVNDTPNKRAVFNPAIAASPDGQHVTIAFYDKRNDPGQGYLVDLYLAESFDGGETWEPNLRLTEFSSDLRKTPRNNQGDYLLAHYQGIVPALNFDTPGVAVWIDTRDATPDPYVVRINRTRGTTFDTWRKLRFSTNELANVALSGENADPDGDRIPNLAEYAFGLEPNWPDAMPTKISRDASSLPQSIILTHRQLAVLADVEFSWESTEDFLNWTAEQPTAQRIPRDLDPTMQRVETTMAIGLETRRFFRLKLRRKV